MNIEHKVNAIMRYIAAESQEEKKTATEEIKAMIEHTANVNQTGNIEDVISEIFLELGVPDHILGYRYSAFAIRIATENPDIINAITGELYPAVAKKFNTTSNRAERAIRNAIEVSCDRISNDAMAKYFGNTISTRTGKPTNSEFIARIANIVRRRMRNG